MGNKRTKKIILILDELYQISEIYKNSKNNKQKIMIFIKCEPLFLILEKLKIPKSFSKTFVAYGNEFLVSEFGMDYEKWKKKLLLDKH